VARLDGEDGGLASARVERSAQTSPWEAVLDPVVEVGLGERFGVHVGGGGRGAAQVAARVSA